MNIKKVNGLLESVKDNLTEVGEPGMPVLAYRELAYRQPVGPWDSGQPIPKDFQGTASSMLSDIVAALKQMVPYMKVVMDKDLAVVSSGSGGKELIRIGFGGPGSNGSDLTVMWTGGDKYVRPGGENQMIQPIVPFEQGLDDDGNYNPTWIANSQQAKALIANVARMIKVERQAGAAQFIK